MTPRFASRTIRATPEALELIESLKERHGAIAFFQLGSCHDGSEPICLTRGELLPSPDDLRLGEVAGAPFYVEQSQHHLLGGPELLIDVSPGSFGHFPLEGLEDIHFVVRVAARADADVGAVG